MNGHGIHVVEHTFLMARKENYLAVSVMELLEGATKPAENAKAVALESSVLVPVTSFIELWCKKGVYLLIIKSRKAAEALRHLVENLGSPIHLPVSLQKYVSSLY